MTITGPITHPTTMTITGPITHPAHMMEFKTGVVESAKNKRARLDC